MFSSRTKASFMDPMSDSTAISRISMLSGNLYRKDSEKRLFRLISTSDVVWQVGRTISDRGRDEASSLVFHRRPSYVFRAVSRTAWSARNISSCNSCTFLARFSNRSRALPSGGIGTTISFSKISLRTSG